MRGRVGSAMFPWVERAAARRVRYPGLGRCDGATGAALEAWRLAAPHLRPIVRHAFSSGGFAFPKRRTKLNYRLC
ncbi:hypothetical protein B0G81_6687 [Paraburkholderia sp. BL6665CI2N2]|nr:hypothetical protein B0G81_6687 [Paraburkholderia sp. BL6665CI2N2]